MVVLNRIYTRAGDDGTTALGTGERRKKYDLRIAAYGTLDEVNAVAHQLLTRPFGAAVLGPQRSKKSLPQPLRRIAG